MSFNVRMDEQLTFDMFTKRDQGENITVPKAFERNFKNPKTPIEKEIWQLIEKHFTDHISQLESELFEQKTKQNKAKEALNKKSTKTAQNRYEVAGRQIERILKRIEKVKDRTEKEGDSRIFPQYYAPVIILKDGKRTLVPMRYLLRPNGMKPSFDKTYNTCYNARRDNLAGFWKKQFGTNHGVIIVEAFFENVAKHDFEKRQLREGEEEENLILKFEPKGMEYMVIPVIWDKWVNENEELYSFALITDEPPPEVLETGHDRCPIFLNESRIDDWLNPVGKSQMELFEILDDRSRPFYKHALAG
ncbi:MAG: SOS response-associated peptidase family protein [Bdellovibrionaceae bacterium]|nr:SOS response-associated peptidase family protein [Pseudobdellovibrionaceae bacterium]